MSLIEKQFWILSARRVINNVINGCSVCVRQAATNAQPIIANILQSHDTQCRPLSRVDIDFAGPFQRGETRLRKVRVLFC